MRSSPDKEFLYGLNPAFEAIRAGRRKVSTAYLSESAKRNPRIKKLFALLHGNRIPATWTNRGHLFNLCGTHDHQGAVLDSGPYPYSTFHDQLGSPRLLLLDNVEDPQNVGAILRSAEVFGFNSILLAKKGVPPVFPSVVKASAGASEFLRISKDFSANNAASKAKENGFLVVALDVKGSCDISQLNDASRQKIMLVVGGEDKAVGQYILRNADFNVRLPQHGRINSLNASVAAGIAMFCLSPYSCLGRNTSITDSSASR